MTLSYAAIVKLHDQVSGPARQVVQSTRGMAHTIKQAQAMIANGYDKTISRMQTMVSLASKISVVTGGGLAAAGASALKTGSQFEDLRTTLKVMEGSATQAREAMRWIKDFNLESPYEMRDVSQAYLQFKNQGLDPKGGLMQTAVDLAAAFPEKQLDDAVQMFKDAAMGDGMRLMEFGIKQRKIEGKKGKRSGPKGLSMVGGASSTGDTADSVEYTYIDSKGIERTVKVAADNQKEMVKTIQAIFNEKFKGLAAERSKTLSGISSNLKDTIAELQQQFIRATKDTSNDKDGGIYQYIKDSLEARRQSLLALAKSGKVAEWGQQATDYVKKFSSYLQIVKAQIRPLIDYVKNLAGGWKQLALYMGSGAGIWALLPLLSALARAVSLPALILAGGLAAWKTWHHLLPALANRFPLLNTYLQRFNHWLERSKQTIKEQGISAWLIQLRDQTKAPFILHFKLIKQGWEQRDQWLNKLSGKASQLFPNARPELSELRKQLGLLAQNGQAAFAQLITWASRSTSGFQKLFGQGLKSSLAWLNTQLQALNQRIANGTLGQWFDELWQKIQPAIQAVKEFATGLWESVLAIKATILWVKDFVGGWENLGKLVVGLALVSVFSGLLSGLASIMQITASAGGALFSLGKGAAWLAKTLKSSSGSLKEFFKDKQLGQKFKATLSSIGTKIVSVFKKVGAGVLWVARTALPMLGRALLFVGRLFMATPIGLAITAIIGLGYLLWSNWDWVSKKVAAAIEWLSAKWVAAKAAFAESSWGKGLAATFDFFMHPAESALNLITKIKDKWDVTKSALAETGWGRVLVPLLDTLIHPIDSLKQLVGWLNEKWIETRNTLDDTAWGKGFLWALERINTPLGNLKDTFEWLFQKLASIPQYVADGLDSAKPYVEMGLKAHENVGAAASTFLEINKTAFGQTINRISNWWNNEGSEQSTDAVSNVSNYFGANDSTPVSKTQKFTALKSALEVVVAQNLQGMTEAQTRAYAANVMKTESAGRIDAVNSYGFSGQYQFGAEALAEAGLVDQDKLKVARQAAGKAWYKGGHHKAFLANAANWRLAGGQQAFLANKALQDRAFIEYTNRNIQAGMRSGALKTGDDAGQVAAYAKAAHLKGVGGANKLFLQGIASRDAYGTSTASYANQARLAMQTLAADVERTMQTNPQSTQHVKPIQSTAGAVKQLSSEVRGQHELTVNVKAAPGVVYNVEDKKSTGQASRFDVGKQAGAL